MATMHLFLTFLVFVATLAAAVPALAQPARPERPYRGLFGGGIGETEQLLTMKASIGAGYDDNVLAGSSGGGGFGGLGEGDPRQSRAGGFGQFGGSLEYSLNRSRVSFAASLASSSRYYATLPTKFVGTYSGSVGSALQVARGTRLQASQSVSRRPFLTLGLFPAAIEPGLGDPDLVNLDLGIQRDDYVSYASSVALSQQLSRRGSVSASYGRYKSDFAGSARDLTRWSAGGRFTLGLTRGLGVHLGYGYTTGEYAAIGGGRSIQGRNIDAGVDFNRALSFSRRTTLSFSTGSSAISDRRRTYYRLIGTARLNHEIGRTWNAALAYDRGVGFIETFGDPFFSDAASLRIGGTINRRLQFHSGASISVGDVGLSGGGNGFNTYSGTSGLNLGLSRHFGLALDYAYYHYSFKTSAALPSGLPREMNRQNITASLSLWAPLVHRARRPNAAR